MNEGISSVSYSLIKPPERRWINLYLGIAISVLILITWSAFASLDVMVFANGKVIPASDLKTVQHLEGGILAEIYVKKGDVVNVGDKLLKVNNINVSTQLGEVSTRLNGIIGSLSRLEAEISGKETLVFDDLFLNAFPDNAIINTASASSLSPDAVQLKLTQSLNWQFNVNKTRDKALIQTQRDIKDKQSNEKIIIARHQQELFKQNRKALHEQLSLIPNRLNKNRQEQTELKKQLHLSNQNISLMQEELDLSESLFKEDAISKVELLQLRRSLHALMAEEQKISGQILAKQNEENRTQQELDERHSDYTSQAIAKRNELENKKNGLLKIIEGASDKSERRLVLSPVSGVVNQVFVNTIGGVIQPGMDLLEIVPDDNELLIDAKIKPEDIAQLVLGQKANVRLTAYDFAIYGSLPGVIDYIGADTLEERDGEKFYVAHIRIDNTLENNKQRYPVLPGMVANVDVITGKRNILSYITKPIVKTRQKALRER